MNHTDYLDMDPKALGIHCARWHMASVEKRCDDRHGPLCARLTDVLGNVIVDPHLCETCLRLGRDTAEAEQVRNEWAGRVVAITIHRGMDKPLCKMSPRDKHVLQLHGLRSHGLGDLVAWIAKRLGFHQRPGCGCAERQRKMNWLELGRRRRWRINA